MRLIIGSNIRCFRKKKNWTQEKLSGEVGLTGDYIGRLERGMENITVDNLVKFSRIFHVQPAALLTKDYCRNNNDHLHV
jgi:transcriptional regulator with XRE-family HTH domain